MAWIKWSQVCKPKACGGLGVKNLHFFNVALLTKWRWRMLTGSNTELWKRVLEARYGKVMPWFGSGLTVNENRRSSIWWRDLACLGGDFNSGLSWFNEVTKKRIGNGETIKFWWDKWFGTQSLAELFPSLLASHIDSGVTVAEMGMWLDTGWKWKWEMAERTVHNAGSHAAVTEHNTTTNAVSAASIAAYAAIGPAATAAGFHAVTESSALDSWPSFVVFLQGAQLSKNEDDRWIWLPDPVRSFSVKSCYSWLSENNAGENEQYAEQQINACKSLWKTDLPSKVLVFCWRALLGKLPTRNNLLARGIIPSLQQAMCVFCQKELETCDHLFCNCGIIKEVWGKVMIWLNVLTEVEDNVVLMFESMGKMIKGKGASRVKWFFWATAVYQIWLARNNAIFNGKAVTITGIVNAIKIASWGWFIARRGRSSGINFAEWFSCPMGCISNL